MPQFLAAPYPWPSKVMVKVLPFHDELPIPPLVKEKKEESSYSRVFEPRLGEPEAKPEIAHGK